MQDAEVLEMQTEIKNLGNDILAESDDDKVPNMKLELQKKKRILEKKRIMFDMTTAKELEASSYKGKYD